MKKPAPSNSNSPSSPIIRPQISSPALMFSLSCRDVDSILLAVLALAVDQPRQGDLTMNNSFKQDLKQTIQFFKSILPLGIGLTLSGMALNYFANIYTPYGEQIYYSSLVIVAITFTVYLILHDKHNNTNNNKKHKSY